MVDLEITLRYKYIVNLLLSKSILLPTIFAQQKAKVTIRN